MIVDEQDLGVQHDLQQIHRLLRIGVREIEGLDHLFLKAPPFLERFGIDKDGVVAHNFFLQRMLGEHKVQSRFDRQILHKNARFGIALHIFIEHEIEAAGAREGLKDHVQRSLAEIQQGKSIVFQAKLRLGRRGLRGLRSLR